MKTKNLDSTLYISIRYTSFIIASIVSALLNLFLFTSLDPSYVWLLATISICLEGTKVSTLMTKNCFASIYEKIRRPSLKVKEHVFFGFYLLLAVLSITAGLGFSLTITARTEAQNTSKIEIMQERLKSIQLKMDEIANLSSEIHEIQSITLYDYEPYKNAKELYDQKRANYDQINAEYQQAIGLRNSSEEITDQYKNAILNISRLAPLRTAAMSERDNAAADLKRAEAQFNTRKNIDNQQIILEELNEELKILIIQAGLEDSTGTVAIMQLNEQIRQEEQKHIIERGMAYMFDQFALYLHTTPQLIKLCILLFVAILIELTIYQTSIDIKITRGVLYFFRNSLPHDVDVHEILLKFDEENKKFEDIMNGSNAVNNNIEKTKKARRAKKIEVLNVAEEKTVKIDEKELNNSNETEHSHIETNNIVDEQPAQMVHIPKPPHIENQSIATAKENTVKQVSSGQCHEIYQFRFGKASNIIKESISKFISGCCDPEKSNRFIDTPTNAALRLKINDKTRDVFLDRLSKINLDGKPVITSDGFNNWYSNFPSQQIIDYVTEVIS